MHASTALILAAAGFAAAQTAPSGCGEAIDLIIESCLGTTQIQFDACTPNDWDCLCNTANTVLTCYNNCPSAPDRFGFEQTKVANCNAASAYGTSTSSRASATGTSSTATTNVAASNSATSTPSSSSSSDDEETSGTRSGSAASATATGDSGAASVAVPAGLAAIFGLVAFL